jgi:hypothetical protein
VTRPLTFDTVHLASHVLTYGIEELARATSPFENQRATIQARVLARVLEAIVLGQQSVEGAITSVNAALEAMDRPALRRIDP